MAELHGGHIGHAHRHTGCAGDGDMTDIVQRLHQADAAHHQLLVAAGQQAAADIGVAIAQGLRQLRQRHAVALQLLWIGQHLVLPHHAAEAVDVGHARHALQFLEDLPILQTLQLGQIDIRIFGGDAITHDLAGGVGVGAEAGLHPGGEVDLAEILLHVLPRLEIAAALAELDGHHRQAEQRHRAHRGGIGHAGQRGLHRHGELALDLQRAAAGPLRDHLHVERRDVRIGLDRQLAERPGAKQQQQRAAEKYQRAVVDDAVDEFLGGGHRG